MIGIVLVSFKGLLEKADYRGLASEFSATLNHVLGPQKQVAVAELSHDGDAAAFRQEVATKIKEVDTGDGVVIATPMFGDEISSIAISLMLKGAKIEVISGVNLNTLVKLAKVREDRPIADAVQIAQATGRKNISIASHVLAGGPPKGPG